MLIRDVIRNREPYSTRDSATVQEAAEFMAERNIGAVCVLDDGGRLLGVFSERGAVDEEHFFALFSTAGSVFP